MLQRRNFAAHIQLPLGEARLSLNEADRAAFGAGAEQRALGTAQNFDTLDVEQPGEGVAGAEPEVANLNRRIVDVHASGCGAGLGRDTVDRNATGTRRLVAREVEARGDAHQVVEI